MTATEPHAQERRKKIVFGALEIARGAAAEGGRQRHDFAIAEAAQHALRGTDRFAQAADERADRRRPLGVVVTDEQGDARPAGRRSRAANGRQGEGPRDARQAGTAVRRDEAAFAQAGVEAADQGRIAPIVGDVGVMTACFQTGFEEGGVEGREWPGTVDGRPVPPQGGPARLRTGNVRGQAAVRGPRLRAKASARDPSLPATVTGTPAPASSRATRLPKVP